MEMEAINCIEMVKKKKTEQGDRKIINNRLRSTMIDTQSLQKYRSIDSWTKHCDSLSKLKTADGRVKYRDKY